MNYELAKELKDAGFPQEVDESIPAPHIFLAPERHVSEPTFQDELAYAPTLSELIEAIGVENFGSLSHYGDEWICSFYNLDDSTRQVEGSGVTPEEAVARLWLALNPKKPLPPTEEVI